MLSFQKQDNIGKAIFENNCKSCHLPNKATEIAPSFQDIRKDYGLKWTLSFLKDSRKLMDKKDIKALYSYYLFQRVEHIRFPVLEPKYVIKVLDYVDGFKIDTSQFKHRLTSSLLKKRFVEYQLINDTLLKNSNIANIDTTNFIVNDSLKSEIGTRKKRYIPKKKED